MYRGASTITVGDGNGLAPSVTY